MVVGMCRNPPPNIDHWQVIDFDDYDGASRVNFVRGCVLGLASKHGSFDGVFHAAGHEVLKPLRFMAPNEYARAMMAADVALALLWAASRSLTVADGGSIVLMSSVAASRGSPALVAYGAGKAAIEAMTRGAAVELAPRRVRVNALAAGAFASPMHLRIVSKLPPESIGAYAAKHPLGFGTTDIVAKSVLHLLSDDSAWTTGTTMVVDGGFLA